eukprot:365011-Chlamydomonas_euryale.AAC.36
MSTTRRAAVARPCGRRGRAAVAATRNMCCCCVPTRSGRSALTAGALRFGSRLSVAGRAPGKARTHAVAHRGAQARARGEGACEACGGQRGGARVALLSV